MRSLTILTLPGLAWLALTSLTAAVQAHELLVKTGGQLNVTATAPGQTCIFEPPEPLADGTVPSCEAACSAKGACTPASSAQPDDPNVCTWSMTGTMCFCCYKRGGGLAPSAQNE